MYDYLTSSDKTVFLNADDPIQRKKLEGYVKKVGYSTTDSSYYLIKLQDVTPHLVLEAEEMSIATQLSGAYNFTNCAIAIVVGKYFGIIPEKIKRALESYIPQNMRTQWVEKGEYRILLDAYNANPSSMSAALSLFEQVEARSKYAILGDMFELGEAAGEEHQSIADQLAEMKLDNAYLVGEHFSAIQTKYPQFKGYDDFKEYLLSNPLPPSSVLIKGSRGMALERILEVL